MSTHFRPKDATETLDFMERHCARCRKLDESERCRIVLQAFLRNAEEALYPPEWTYAASGQPTCTAFEPRTRFA